MFISLIENRVVAVTQTPFFLFFNSQPVWALIGHRQVILTNTQLRLYSPLLDLGRFSIL
jgi:hypothetical protein